MSNPVTRRPEPLAPTIALMVVWCALQIAELIGWVTDPSAVLEAGLTVLGAIGVALPISARNRVTPLTDPRLSDGTLLAPQTT